VRRPLVSDSAHMKLSHSVHGASNFARSYKGPKPPPLEREAGTSAPLHATADPELPQQRIYFIRHAQGEHNVAKDAGLSSSYLMKDPLLSELGEGQARALAAHPAFLSESGDAPAPPELVVASPLRRTMMTAMLGFGAGMPCVLRAELQETGMVPSDCASPELGLELLEAMGWDALRAEYLSLPEDWQIKGSLWKHSVRDRFAQIVAWLGTRPERSVAVVSHHDFFKTSLGVSLQPAEVRMCTLQGGRLFGLPSSSASSSPSGSAKISPAGSFSRISANLSDLFLHRSGGSTRSSRSSRSPAGSASASPLPSPSPSKTDLASYLADGQSSTPPLPTTFKVSIG